MNQEVMEKWSIIYLTSTDIVTYIYCFNPIGVQQGIFDMIANSEIPFNSLIYTGALITAISNYEVAFYLLSHRLSINVDGVVFLDETWS